MRKLILISLLFISVNELTAQKLKIGFVQRQVIFQQLAQKEGTQNTLQQSQLKMRKELERMRDYVSQREFDSLSYVKNQEYTAYQNKLITSLNTRIDNAITDISKKRKIKHLLYQYSPEGLPVVLYADPETNEKYNITYDVLKLLGVVQ